MKTIVKKGESFQLDVAHSCLKMCTIVAGKNFEREREVLWNYQKLGLLKKTEH